MSFSIYGGCAAFSILTPQSDGFVALYFLFFHFFGALKRWRMLVTQLWAKYLEGDVIWFSSSFSWRSRRQCHWKNDYIHIVVFWTWVVRILWTARMLCEQFIKNELKVKVLPARRVRSSVFYFKINIPTIHTHIHICFSPAKLFAALMSLSS